MSNITAEEKNDFLKKQEKCFKIKTENSFPSSKMFMPQDGICWKCSIDIVEKEINKGNDGSELVTGCPSCLRTFCD